MAENGGEGGGGGGGEADGAEEDPLQNVLLLLEPFDEVHAVEQEEEDENQADNGEALEGTPQPPPDRPYIFRRERPKPESLYSLARNTVMHRYFHTSPLNTKFHLNEKIRFRRKKEQLERYFGVLPDHLKHDLLRFLFSGRCLTYRQSHRTNLDLEMFDNNLCCTNPEECTGCHGNDYIVPNHEAVLIWSILQGKKSSCLDLLPFMEGYQHNFMLEDLLYSLGSRQNIRYNQLRDLEQKISKNPGALPYIQNVLFIGTFREANAPVWGKLLSSMINLQSLELHFWTGDILFPLIRDVCSNLREIIFFRQRQSTTNTDLLVLPSIVRKFKNTLKVFIVDSREKNFPSKSSKELQRALSECDHLECLKLESEKSPYIDWHNSRYKVKTKKLLMTLRRNFNYLTIMRNINRCFNADVAIDLFFDTYVSIKHHKHSYYPSGPGLDGGDSTVSQDTRDFEEKELNQSFVKLMSEFGAKVDRLSVETDIRPEYFHRLFPNIEYLEMFARASRKVAVHDGFTETTWSRLKDFALETDPEFSAMTPEGLLVHAIGDVLEHTTNLTSIKVLASSSALMVSERSLVLRLRRLTQNMTNLETIEILSPYCLSNSGFTAALAEFFIRNCPRLRVLRDVAGWNGTPENWRTVVELADEAGLSTGWAAKTTSTLHFTIDFDAEGWYQTDTGHNFELYSNLNVDADFAEADDIDVDDLEFPF